VNLRELNRRTDAMNATLQDDNAHRAGLLAEREGKLAALRDKRARLQEERR
jgi:hypothetical protein